jgi:polyhydroxyalkanoate synthesis regulator phasin
MQANNRVNTGELSPETRAWIDEIYKQNADLINQQAQQYIDAQSRNLVDKMAGRGILTSGVTGRAMGEMMAEADKTRQQALTEALKQRATTMLQMPFQQQEAAAQLLQGITTGTQLTGTEAQTIVDSLMKQWGMSRENAEAALNNLIANYGQV